VEKIESFYSPDKGASWTVLTLNCSRKSDDGILQQISMIPKLDLLLVAIMSYAIKIFLTKH
jgi:hypothetical protein